MKLAVECTKLAADGRDTVAVAVSVVDGAGRVVPTAANMVRFAVRGAGVNAGVGNGDPSSHEPNQADTQGAFNGLGMVPVKAARQGGAVRLTASAEGLAGAG